MADATEIKIPKYLKIDVPKLDEMLKVAVKKTGREFGLTVEEILAAGGNPNDVGMTLLVGGFINIVNQAANNEEVQIDNPDFDKAAEVSDENPKRIPNPTLVADSTAKCLEAVARIARGEQRVSGSGRAERDDALNWARDFYVMQVLKQKRGETQVKTWADLESLAGATMFAGIKAEADKRFAAPTDLLAELQASLAAADNTPTSTGS